MTKLTFRYIIDEKEIGELPDLLAKIELVGEGVKKFVLKNGSLTEEIIRHAVNKN